MWDFGSGQDIKWREGRGTDDDHSVLGLQYCEVDGQRCIVALGWNNHLHVYLVHGSSQYTEFNPLTL